MLIIVCSQVNNFSDTKRKDQDSNTSLRRASPAVLTDTLFGTYRYRYVNKKKMEPTCLLDYIFDSDC